MREQSRGKIGKMQNTRTANNERICVYLHHNRELPVWFALQVCIGIFGKERCVGLRHTSSIRVDADVV
jgi:hypothetical protein